MEDYNINKVKSNIIGDSICHLWIVNQYGEVLIKSIPKHIQTLTIENITLASLSIEGLLYEFKKQCGLRCHETNLQEIYAFTSNDSPDIKYHGYIIECNLNPLILTKTKLIFKGRFIGYRDLYDAVKNYNTSHDFKECFFSTLDILEQKFGLSPIDLIHI
jgi:hypothetical protein